MPLSRRTLVRLAEGMPDALTHSDLDALFYEFDVQGHDPAVKLGSAMTNKTKRSLAWVQAIEAKFEDDAQEIFLDMAHRVLVNDYRRERLVGLVASLSIDGLEWGGERLVPSEPGAAPLAPEITALEQELNALGLNVAATHYRQAVDNFTDGNFEACNGQLRSFLEDLIKGAARRRGLEQVAGAPAALNHLRDTGVLDNEEWGILRALWHGAQDNGPHAGLTEPEEARFRLHFATAAGRYLAVKVR